jgi:REP element-mobilizing transposase RayT
MARPLRIELGGGFYHVTAHGNGRLWLFRNDDNRNHFLNLLGASVLKYQVEIHAFVLMVNHIHLLVETRVPNLSQFMRKCLSDYALYYNRLYRRSGSVFKSRYGSFFIQEDNYYLALVRYLYNNPMKVGLVKSPYRYRWSSLYYLLHKAKMKEISWYKADHVLRLVGGKRGLIELMGTGEEELPIMYRTFIGNKEWADKIIEEHSDRLSDEISREKEMRRGTVDIGRAIRDAAKIYGVSREVLITGKHKESRGVCINYLYHHTPLMAREIADIFKMSKWAVHKTVQRIAGRKKAMKMLQTLKHKMS